MLAGSLLGACYLGADVYAQREHRLALAQELEFLEKQIAQGNTNAATWLRYAQGLAEDGKFHQAAQAGRKVLNIQPYHREARIAVALYLARANDRTGLLDYMRGLTYEDAKMAVDLFDRQELAPWSGDEAFIALRREARQQSMD